MSRLLAVCSLSAFLMTSAASADLRFACTGPLAPGASHASLVSYFGQANVVVGDVYVGEGNSESGTIVYPKDPAKRIEITWKKDKIRRWPATVRVGDAADWNRSEWRTSKNVTLGTTLLQLERINGRTFRLLGFDWDYAGTVVNWSEGALESSGPCTLTVRLQPDPNRPSQYESRVSGESEFSSGNAAMRAINPYVYLMILDYGE
jgi:hypothetical protein